MQAIINTKLILEDSYVWDGAVTFENGRIVQCGKRAEVDIPADAELIDAQGLYTAPGLVDIHNHGTVREHFYAAPRACADFFLSHGETTVLPTFYCNLTLQQMLQGLENVKTAIAQGAGNLGRPLYGRAVYERRGQQPELDPLARGDPAGGITAADRCDAAALRAFGRSTRPDRGSNGSCRTCAGRIRTRSSRWAIRTRPPRSAAGCAAAG